MPCDATAVVTARIDVGLGDLLDYEPALQAILTKLHQFDGWIGSEIRRDTYNTRSPNYVAFGNQGRTLYIYRNGSIRLSGGGRSLNAEKQLDQVRQTMLPLLTSLAGKAARLRLEAAIGEAFAIDSAEDAANGYRVLNVRV